MERGRFTQISLELSLCILCEEKSIEDEKHFLFECSYYNSIRNKHYSKFRENFIMINNEEKVKYLMCADVVKMTAEFIYICYCKKKGIYI